MDKIQPIAILLVTYQRLHFLKRIIKSIKARTFYPNYVFVVDNGSTDGTQDYLRHQKVVGNITDYLFLPENIGQPKALNELFKFIIERDKKCITDDLFITTQDDLIPPKLSPCWLERLKHLFEKNEPDYGAICMRIERTARLEWEEGKDEIIENHKSMPSVFRMARKSDILKLGDRPFGRLRHWESHGFADQMKFKLKKKFGMATNLYASHIGYMSENKGYIGDFKDYFTYSPERVKQGEAKPYPVIDPKTNIPLRITHGVDTPEHKKREEFWNNAGVELEIKEDTSQRSILGQYCKEGKVLDIGCGSGKCHPNCVGIDIYPHPCVDIVHDGSDLWMFKDGEIDTIVACHSLEHMNNLKETLREWTRVLRIGGILAFIVPDGELRPEVIRVPSHKVAFTKPILKQLIAGVFRYKIIELRTLSELRGANSSRCILCVAQKQ